MGAMARTLLDGIRVAGRRYDLFGAGARVVVAVSGGPDSVALLAALHALREELHLEVVAAHVDHGLRGPESEADAVLVANLAASLDVPCRLERITVAAGNVEAEARRARYAALERIADVVDATRIATAHTLEDQAETVFLRFVRGAGRRGLSGIRPRRGRIVRPLLLCDRVQVRGYLAERGLGWRRDRSNFDFALSRAQARHGYLPALTREMNPRLVRTLARLADTMREEDRLLDRLAARAGGRGPGLDSTILAVLDPPLARRAIRTWWRRHGSGRRLGLGHVDAVLDLARRTDDASVHVPGGTIARVGRALGFRPGTAPIAVTPPYHLTIEAGETVVTPGGWRISARDGAPGDVEPSDFVCVIDAAQVPRTLAVRNRRPGDRIRLLGLGGRTSVKRLLIARRVPRAVRGELPIVTAREGRGGHRHAHRSECHRLIGGHAGIVDIEAGHIERSVRHVKPGPRPCDLRLSDHRSPVAQLDAAFAGGEAVPVDAIEHAIEVVVDSVGAVGLAARATAVRAAGVGNPRVADDGQREAANVGVAVLHRFVAHPALVVETEPFVAAGHGAAGAGGALCGRRAVGCRAADAGLGGATRIDAATSEAGDEARVPACRWARDPRAVTGHQHGDPEVALEIDVDRSVRYQVVPLIEQTNHQPPASTSQTGGLVDPEPRIHRGVTRDRRGSHRAFGAVVVTQRRLDRVHLDPGNVVGPEVCDQLEAARIARTCEPEP